MIKIYYLLLLLFIGSISNAQKTIADSIYKYTFDVVHTNNKYYLELNGDVYNVTVIAINNRGKHYNVNLLFENICGEFFRTNIKFKECSSVLFSGGVSVSRIKVYSKKLNMYAYLYGEVVDIIKVKNLSKISQLDRKYIKKGIDYLYITLYINTQLEHNIRINVLDRNTRLDFD